MIHSPQRQNVLPWRFLLTVYVVMVLLTTAVPVFDWVRRPDGMRVTGYSYESVGDIFYYLNLIEQGAHGNFLFRNFMTGEPHGPTFLHPLFLVLGWFSGLFHLSPLVVWHGARIILVFFFLIAFYRLLQLVVAHEQQRRWAFLLTLVAGGLLAHNSEGSVFLPLLYSPLQTFTLLTSVVFFLTFLQRRQKTTLWTWSIFLGLTTLQAATHPYILPVWVVAPLVFLWLDVLARRLAVRQAILQYAPIAVGGIVGCAYLAFVVLGNPILRAWSVRAINPPWRFPETLLVLGIRPFLFAVGVVVVWPVVRRNAGIRFLLVWIVTVLVLAYSPYLYAGRLMLLLHIPLGIVASFGGWWFWHHAGRSAGKRLAVVFLLTIALSDTVSHLWFNFYGRYPGSGFRYVDNNTFMAMQWVRRITPGNALILHAPTWDTLLAQQAYRQAYVVSGGLTADYEKKLFYVLSFYAGKFTLEQMRDFLGRARVAYVVVSDRERISGYAESKIYGNPMYKEQYAFNFHPQRYPFLRLVYDKEGFSLYQFIVSSYAN